MNMFIQLLRHVLVFSWFFISGIDCNGGIGLWLDDVVDDPPNLTLIVGLRNPVGVHLGYVLSYLVDRPIS